MQYSNRSIILVTEARHLALEKLPRIPMRVHSFTAVETQLTAYENHRNSFPLAVKCSGILSVQQGIHPALAVGLHLLHYILTSMPFQYKPTSLLMALALVQRSCEVN